MARAPTAWRRFTWARRDGRERIYRIAHCQGRFAGSCQVESVKDAAVCGASRVAVVQRGHDVLTVAAVREEICKGGNRPKKPRARNPWAGDAIRSAWEMSEVRD